MAIRHYAVMPSSRAFNKTAYPVNDLELYITQCRNGNAKISVVPTVYLKIQ